MFVKVACYAKDCKGEIFAEQMLCVNTEKIIAYEQTFWAELGQMDWYRVYLDLHCKGARVDFDGCIVIKKRDLDKLIPERRQA